VGLSESFEAIHDIHAMAYKPKPHPHAYESMIQAFRLDPARSLFADDLARNLPPAKALGLTTLWIDNGSEQVGEDSGDAIDYRTADLGLWLDDIMGTE
jgi:putative hydrolase of the HAD superfamily